MFPTKEIFRSNICYKSCNVVARICEPLKKHLGIDYFGIQCETINWKTGNIDSICLNNSYEQFDIFHDYHQKKGNYKIDIKANLENYQQNYNKYLLDSPKIVKVAHEIYGVHNVLRKLEKVNDNEWMKFVFATKSHDTKYLSFYLNNIDILDKFILYFKDKAETLIKKAAANKIFSRALAINHENGAVIKVIGETLLDKNRLNFLKQIELSHHRLVNKIGNIIKIPHGEMLCLQLLARGRTLKEIANTLNISPRTVESNLNNAKRRLNCFTRKELLDLLELNNVK